MLMWINYLAWAGCCSKEFFRSDSAVDAESALRKSAAGLGIKAMLAVQQYVRSRYAPMRTGE